MGYCQDLLLMMNHKNFVFALLVGLLVFSFLITFSDAATFSFTVPAGEEINQEIDLALDDQIIIKFSVVGAENSFISFSLVYPNATEKDFGEVGVFSHGFVCDANGEYNLNFVNTDVTESKLVTLNYEVEHYILGIPQMLFLALTVVVVCVAMVAAYILLGPSP